MLSRVTGHQIFFNGVCILSKQLHICLFHNTLPPYWNIDLSALYYIIRYGGIHKGVLICGNDNSLLERHKPPSVAHLAMPGLRLHITDFCYLVQGSSGLLNGVR